MIDMFLGHIKNKNTLFGADGSRGAIKVGLPDCSPSKKPRSQNL